MAKKASLWAFLKSKRIERQGRQNLIHMTKPKNCISKPMKKVALEQVLPLEIFRKSHPGGRKGTSTSAFGHQGRELSGTRRKGTCVSASGARGRELSGAFRKGTKIRVPAAREGRL